MDHKFGGFSAISESNIPSQDMMGDGGLPGSPFFHSSGGSIAHTSITDVGIPVGHDVVTPNEHTHEAKVAMGTDGGDGSGVMRRHHVEGLSDRDRDRNKLSEAAHDSLGPTGKKFTEHLHARKSDGTYEPHEKNKSQYLRDKE
jgi:hypothetical protein